MHTNLVHIIIEAAHDTLLEHLQLGRILGASRAADRHRHAILVCIHVLDGLLVAVLAKVSARDLEGRLRDAEAVSLLHDLFA